MFLVLSGGKLFKQENDIDNYKIHFVKSTSELKKIDDE